MEFVGHFFIFPVDFQTIIPYIVTCQAGIGPAAAKGVALMTSIFGNLTENFPSIAEQREIEAHNAPIIDALSVAVLQAQRLFGRDSAEHKAACRIFDTAIERQNTKL